MPLGLEAFGVQAFGAAGFGAGPNVLLKLPLLKGLSLSAGAGTVTTVNTTSVVFKNSDGVLETCPAGIPCFEGGRLTVNLAASPATPVTHNITVEIGRSYQFTIGAASAAGATAVLSGACTGTLAGDAVNRLSFASGTPKTATTATLTCTITGAIANLQVEDVTAKTNKMPSLFTATYQWHDTASANTVNGSGVVTETIGSALTTLRGLVTEPSRVHVLLRSRNLALSPWSNTGTTSVAKNEIGMDGALEAHTLTAPSAATISFISQSATIIATTNVSASSILVLKDAVETRFPLQSLELYGGTAVILASYQLNTKTGAITPQDTAVGVISSNVVLRSIAGREWWDWTVTAKSESNTSYRFLFAPALSSSFGFRVTAAGSVVVDNPQVVINSSVTGRPVVTDGVNVTTSPRSASIPDSGKMKNNDCSGGVTVHPYYKFDRVRNNETILFSVYRSATEHIKIVVASGSSDIISLVKTIGGVSTTISTPVGALNWLADQRLKIRWSISSTHSAEQPGMALVINGTDAVVFGANTTSLNLLLSEAEPISIGEAGASGYYMGSVRDLIVSSAPSNLAAMSRESL